MRTQRYLKPWIFGVILAAVIVLAEGLLRIYPPSAYAFCLAGHTRDLVNTILNRVGDSAFPQTLLSRRYLILTSPAVILGAWGAARFHGERRPRPAEGPFSSFLLGFALMLCGLAVFGCPVRIVIRAGYGEWYGLVALAGMLSGITVTTVLMRWRWRVRG